MQLAVKGGAVSQSTVLSVVGEVDVFTAPILRDRIAELIDSGRRLLEVDLSCVEFLDSTGLGVLVGGLSRAQEVGGNVVLVGPQPPVVKLLRITGLDQIFEVHPAAIAV